MFCFVASGSLVAVSLWIALDPPVSPRNLGLGAAAPDAVLLSALIIGYCSGYLLLVGSVPIRKLVRFQKSAGTRKLIAKLTVGRVRAAARRSATGIAGRNLGQIRTTNGPALREYARQLYQGCRLANRSCSATIR